jgi:hypothetical protein
MFEVVAVDLSRRIKVLESDSEARLSDDEESQGSHPFIASTKRKDSNSQDDKSDEEDATGIVRTVTNPVTLSKKASPGKPTTPATKLYQANKTKSSLKRAPGEPSSEEEQNSQEKQSDKSDNDITVNVSPVDEVIEIYNKINGIEIEKLLEFLHRKSKQ